jgi:DNA repair protein RadC
MRGASSLTDVDLLGVALGSLSLSRSLHQRFLRWSELGQAEIRATPRFTPARTAQVLAIVELARRFNSHPLQHGQALRCSDDVARAYRGRFAERKQECFVALSLDCRNRVVSEHEIARGSLASVEVHPREVFRPLIGDGAAAAIFAHNHPSGDPSPSTEDRLLCQRLCQAGALLGIPVLDFVVLGSADHVSFADRGYLEAGA